MDNVGIIVREAKPNDTVELGQVIMKASRPHLEEQGLSEATIQKIFSRHSPETLGAKITENRFFVAEDSKNRKLIGIAGLRKDNGSPTFNRISTFYVDPDYQGRGVGRLLYHKLIETANKLGVNKLVVSSSVYAEAIYAHFGFKKVREVVKHYDNGGQSLNIWMEKNL